MMTNKELLYLIFEIKKPSALYPEFESWVSSSRRFKAFAIAYHTKIRAKLKNVREQEGMRDLRAELETAALLVRPERFALEYEKYAATKQRGPDFTVMFKTHTPFNVEVRRIRSIEMNDDDNQARVGKLMRVLCDKVGQMPPGIVNLLWLTAEGELSETELNGAVVTLQQLIERQAHDFFIRHGFSGCSDFVKQYHRLSGIFLHESNKNVLWLNPLARHPVPTEIVNILERLQTV